MTEYIKTVCLLGNGSVGKTSLFKRFVYSKYDETYMQTMGVKIDKKVIGNTRMMIRDVSGQKGLKSAHEYALREVDGAILVCDATREHTLTDLYRLWASKVTHISGNVPIIFVANKCDLKDQQEVDMPKLKRVADEFEMPAYFTSAKTGENVEHIFLDLKDRIFDDKKLNYPVLPEIPSEVSPSTILDIVCDKFVRDHGNGDYGFSSPMLKQQAIKVGIDAENPSEEHINKLIDNLSSVLNNERIGRFRNDLYRESRAFFGKGKGNDIAYPTLR